MPKICSQHMLQHMSQQMLQHMLWVWSQCPHSDVRTSGTTRVTTYLGLGLVTHVALQNKLICTTYICHNKACVICCDIREYHQIYLPPLKISPLKNILPFFLRKSVWRDGDKSDDIPWYVVLKSRCIWTTCVVTHVAWQSKWIWTTSVVTWVVTHVA